MARPNVLEDQSKRNGILAAIAAGSTLDEAAKLVGVTRQVIHRFATKRIDFARDLEAAKLVAGQKLHALTAEVMSTGFDFDVDLEMDSDGAVEAEKDLGVTEFGRLSTKNFMRLCWVAASRGDKHSPAWARLLAPVMLTPTIEAQSRRSAAQERRETLAEQKALTVESTLVAGSGVVKRPRGSGMVVLEVPPNKARPHLAKSVESDQESAGAGGEA